MTGGAGQAAGEGGRGNLSACHSSPVLSMFHVLALLIPFYRGRKSRSEKLSHLSRSPSIYASEWRFLGSSFCSIT